MIVHRSRITKLLQIITVLGFWVWLLCILWFIIGIVFATDLFQRPIYETRFGNSQMFPYLFLFLICLGIFSFLLGLISFLLRLKLIPKNGETNKLRIRWNAVYLWISYLIAVCLLGVYAYNELVYKNDVSIDKKLSQIADVITGEEEKPDELTIEKLIYLTNQEREKVGLEPLAYNTLLQNAAEEKANDMTKRGYWAHNAPDGTQPWVFVRKSGYSYIYAGENLAQGYDYPEDIVKNWMNSKEHRDNILSPNYKEIGFAIREGYVYSTENSESIYNLVVQMFGSPDFYNSSKSNPNPSRQGNSSSVDLNAVRSHLNHVISIKGSWEKTRGRFPDEDLNRLLDSFTRQIDFSRTIISNVENRKGSSADNVALWNAVLKMAEESAAITDKLNRR